MWIKTTKKAVLDCSLDDIDDLRRLMERHELEWRGK
jgi:hypothetical protein